jgi:hypothetical protein
MLLQIKLKASPLIITFGEASKCICEKSFSADFFLGI